MSRNEGNAGVGARWYGDELAVLRGRLTTEDEHFVYPDEFEYPDGLEVADEIADRETRD